MNNLGDCLFHKTCHNVRELKGGTAKNRVMNISTSACASAIDDHLDSLFEADLFLLLLLLFYVRFNPRCHFSARISLSFASLVAYACQNLWLRRARDLGPAAAATTPHARRPVPICHAFQYSRFTQDFRIPSERRRRCPSPSLLAYL